jgi:filamentous hemagglutinin-like outer membrane protein
VKQTHDLTDKRGPPERERSPWGNAENRRAEFASLKRWLARGCPAAGVGALQTIVGQPKANVYLIAPHGTIDLGDAGVRSTGDANFAAQQILNASNLQARGTITGIPTIQAPNVAGLTEASNTAGASQQAAKPTQTEAGERPSIIFVEFVGFGGGDDNDEQKLRGSNKQSQYNPNSAFQLIGDGDLTAEQLGKLTPEERSRVAN